MVNFVKLAVVLAAALLLICSLFEVDEATVHAQTTVATPTPTPTPASPYGGLNDFKGQSSSSFGGGT